MYSILIRLLERVRVSQKVSLELVNELNVLTDEGLKQLMRFESLEVIEEYLVSKIKMYKDNIEG